MASVQAAWALTRSVEAYFTERGVGFERLSIYAFRIQNIGTRSLFLH